MAGSWTYLGRKVIGIVAASASLALAGPSQAQVNSVDPDKAISGDLVPLAQQTAAANPAPSPAPTYAAAPVAQQDPTAKPNFGTGDSASAAAASAAGPAAKTGTYRQDDVIGAAEGVFGKGASGLAGMIEDLLRKQGEPNGYIVGREGGGALVFGLRYGSGKIGRAHV